MAGRIPDAFLDELLARTDIVELINARVPLKRQGREYAACCPFHNERSPSFTVSPTKQFYHCFGCGAHGTALRFLMEYDRLEFLDAVDELAKRAGLEVPRETRQSDQARGEFDALLGISAAAAGFFQHQLALADAARRYLDRRGVDAEVRARYQIGYAPAGWDALREALGTDPQRLQALERAGLLSRNDAGRVYDKFRDRVMFPIHDRRGRPIAFGGRVLGKDDGPKYLNSPETPLFHKGRELYGLWQVKQAHAKIPRLIVVEGYMDVVALAQYGVDTAVATLGTATTGDHAELLFRSAPDVLFCFDGDRAGRGAAWKALEAVLPRMRDGRQAFFLFLPEGEDPDTIVRKDGAGGFEQRLQTATPLSEFLFAELSQDINLGTLDGKARLAERARPLLAQIPDGAFGDLMRQRLGEITGLAAAPSAGPAALAPAPVPRRAGGAPAPRRSLVRGAIALLLHRPRLAESVQPPFLFAALRQPGVPLLVELLGLIRERPDISTGIILEHFAGRPEEAPLQKLAVQDLPGDEKLLRTEFADALVQLDRQTVAQRIAELQAAQRAAGLDAGQKDELRALLSWRAQR
ncbi:DNA primase [Coralloluteibacterium stylophorae]|uniref:DNA primase n=1 Tax=Coralloluteibacterium stylophorae TaxID=1776034 RepID=A0A8J8AXU5_9GAMM|nr:DNA primase [Coralloluteibacterium stylophorae]MBS7458056.1 DNA primase [Coralloluteibacterium stylophorae]